LRKSLEEKLEVTEKLLRVLDGNLTFDRKSESIVNKSNRACRTESAQIKLGEIEENARSMLPPPNAEKRNDSISLMPVLSQRKRALVENSSSDLQNNNYSSDSFVMPAPPPRKKNLSKLSTTSNLSHSSNNLMPPPPSIKVMPPDGKFSGSKKNNIFPTTGTLSTLVSYSNDSAKRKLPEGEKNGQVKRASKDAKQDVWKAPEGQSGDGKTKLNLKFSGRY